MKDSVRHNNKSDLSYATTEALIDSHLNNINKDMAQKYYSKKAKTARVRLSFNKD